LLYASLGGEVPMTATVKEGHIISAGVPLKLRALSVSRAVRDLLERATAADRALRPADGAAWADALKRATQPSRVPLTLGTAFVAGLLLLGAYRLPLPFLRGEDHARPKEVLQPAPHDAQTKIHPPSKPIGDPVAAPAATNIGETDPPSATPSPNHTAAEPRVTPPQQAPVTPKKQTTQRNSGDTPAPATRPAASRIREKEPNELRKDANPISIGTTILGHIGMYSDVDMFRLDLRRPIPKALKIQLTNISESGSMMFFLRSRDNATISGTKSSPVNADFVTKIVLPNTDETLYYFLIVSDGTSSGMEYEVTITAASD
jgi:hypothetical protein